MATVGQLGSSDVKVPVPELEPVKVWKLFGTGTGSREILELSRHCREAGQRTPEL